MSVRLPHRRLSGLGLSPLYLCIIALYSLAKHNLFKARCEPTKVSPSEREMAGFALEEKFILSDPTWQLCEQSEAARSVTFLESQVTPAELVASEYRLYWKLKNVSSFELFRSRQVPSLSQDTCGLVPESLMWSREGEIESSLKLETIEKTILSSLFTLKSCQAAWGSILFLHAFLLLKESRTGPQQLTKAIDVLSVSAKLLNGVWDMRDVPDFVPSTKVFYKTTQTALSSYSSERSSYHAANLLNRIPVKYFTSLSFKYTKQFDISQLEPIEPNLRNLIHAELGETISFLPYRVVPSLSDFSEDNFERKVLVDVGTNEFLGSGASMIRMYEPFFKFDEVHFFEPKPLSIRAETRLLHNITEHNVFTEVCSAQDELDIAHWLKKHFNKKDFVVLKYDVDMGTRGPTLEWAFLKCLIDSGAIQYVDELFIELHFWYPRLGWQHQFHSMYQAFDLLRRLRELHVPVHAWP